MVKRLTKAAREQAEEIRHQAQDIITQHYTGPVDSLQELDAKGFLNSLDAAFLTDPHIAAGLADCLGQLSGAPLEVRRDPTKREQAQQEYITAAVDAFGRGQPDYRSRLAEEVRKYFESIK